MNLSILPDLVLNNIFGFFDIVDLVKSSEVCKKFNIISKSIKPFKTV